MPAVQWIIITAEDLNDKLVAAQVSAIRLIGKATAQANRDASITDVLKRIRRKLENHYTLSATANSIPPELRGMAIWLSIAELQTSIPGLDLTDDQKDRIKTAESDLQRIASGQDHVADPTDPLNPPESQSSGGVEVVNAPCRKYTRKQMEAI